MARPRRARSARPSRGLWRGDRAASRRARHHPARLAANRITATAGLCAAAASGIFVGVQVNHPSADVANIGTTEMTIRESAKALMTVLALAGITGMFVRNRRPFGVLGLAGYLLLSVGFLTMFVNQCIVAYVLPTVAHTDPGYVQAYIDAALGRSARGDIGHMERLFLVSGIAYSPPTGPSPPWRWPRCRSPSAARSPCRPASR
jgi:hypothetical protein